MTEQTFYNVCSVCFCESKGSADNVDEGNVSLSHISGTTWVHWSTPQNPNAVIVGFEIELSKVDIKDVRNQSDVLIFFVTYFILYSVWFY